MARAVQSYSADTWDEGMRVAVVEDDSEQAARIQEILTSGGHDCAVFSSAGAFRKGMRDAQFDFFILDKRLHDANGIELLFWLRQSIGSTVPILVLTADAIDENIAEALLAGADDYVVKPVGRAALLARVKVLSRRYSPEATPGNTIMAGKYAVDPNSRSVLLNGEPVVLTPREFDLAFFLFHHLGKVVARDVVEKAVWGRSFGQDSRTLATHISRLRIKLALRPENGVKLTAVYSLGYRLDETSNG